MKKAELRIGNIIAYNNNGFPVRVNALDTKNCYYNSSCKSSYDSMNGIKLTEEWLLKFGFELMKQSEYTLNTYELNGIKLWNKKMDFSELIFEFSNQNIKYMHQLQNLYFALTNKELTI